MRRFLAALVAVSLVTASLWSWWVKGHESVAEAAASGLPEEMPAFFRSAGKPLAHYSGDPDRWKNPSANHLRAAEAPDHFLDLEDYEDQELPPDRFQAAALLLKLKHPPEKTGMLPYALVENYERLCCAFADLRKSPDDAAIRAKCLVYAGVLSHFTGDAAMPLHTTRDYDGKKDASGKVIQKGIHAKIDAFPEKNHITPEEIARDLKARQIDDVWGYILKTIKESHTHIARCYELDEAGAFDKPTDESRKFILERCRVGAQFTMDLWYTAWVASEKMPPHY